MFDYVTARWRVNLFATEYQVTGNFLSCMLPGFKCIIMHFVIYYMYYIISYNCTISASPLGLQLHPNQLWPKTEDVWEQQYRKLHWTMSPGTANQKCLSIAIVRLLSCITSNSSLYSDIVSEIARRDCISQMLVIGYGQFVNGLFCKSSHGTFQS